MITPLCRHVKNKTMSNPPSRIVVRGMTAKPESSFFRQLQTIRHRLQGVQYNVPEYICLISVLLPYTSFLTDMSLSISIFSVQSGPKRIDSIMSSNIFPLLIRERFDEPGLVRKRVRKISRSARNDKRLPLFLLLVQDHDISGCYSKYSFLLHRGDDTGAEAFSGHGGLDKVGVPPAGFV